MRLIDVIKEITGITKQKVSYTDIATALDVSRQYANQIKDKNITKEQLSKLESYFGINLANVNQPVLSSTSEENDADCVTVEHIHINPSCGAGTAVYYDADITPVKLGTQLIREIMNVSRPENLKIFKASGDSMSPTIEDGDILLVDVGRTDFNNGGIFLLTINNDWFIKRLRLKINGELEIISENAAKYGAPEVLHPFDDIEIVIKGRVVKNLSRGL